MVWFGIWATGIKPWWWGGLFNCSNPTDLSLSSLNYSTVQNFGNNILYVEGTCVWAGVALNFKAVIDSSTWEILPNWKVEWLYSRESSLAHASWEEVAIWAGTITWGTADVVICWAFNPQAVSNQTFTFSWPSEINANTNWQYSWEFSNAWPDIATDVEIRIPLPSWVNYVSDTWSGSVVWTDVVWNLWDIIAWWSVSVDVVFEFTTHGAKSFVASASDSIPSTSTIVRTVNTNCLFADIEISMAGNNTPEYWMPTAYTISVINNWPTLARNVVATIERPAEIWRTTSNGNPISGSQEVINIGTMSPWTNNYTRYFRGLDIGQYDINLSVEATTPDGQPLNNETTQTLDIQLKSIDLSRWVAALDYWDLVIWGCDMSDLINQFRDYLYTNGDVQLQIQLPAWSQSFNWQNQNSLLSNYTFDLPTLTALWDFEWWGLIYADNGSIWLTNGGIWNVNAWDLVFSIVVNSPFGDTNTVNNIYTLRIEPTASFNSNVSQDQTYDLDTIIDTNMLGTLTYALDASSTATGVSINWTDLTTTAWASGEIVVLITDTDTGETVTASVTISVQTQYVIRLDFWQVVTLDDIVFNVLQLDWNNELPNFTKSISDVNWSIWNIWTIDTTNTYWPWLINPSSISLDGRFDPWDPYNQLTAFDPTESWWNITIWILYDPPVP